MQDSIDINISSIVTVLDKTESCDFHFENRSRCWDGFVLFTDGTGEFVDNDGNSHHFTRGSLLLLNQYDKYEIYSKGGCSYITSALYMTDNTDELALKVPAFIECSDKHIRKIKDICSIWNQHTPISYTTCKIKLLELYLEIYLSQLEIVRDIRDDIETVKQYLHMNYGKNYCFEDMIRIVSLSPSYLRIKFKAVTGTTITKYRESLRIARACEMLRSGHYTQSETAFELGYYDTFHFSKAFKKETGYSPSKLRD